MPKKGHKENHYIGKKKTSTLFDEDHLDTHKNGGTKSCRFYRRIEDARAVLALRSASASLS